MCAWPCARSHWGPAAPACHLHRHARNVARARATPGPSCATETLWLQHRVPVPRTAPVPRRRSLSPSAALAAAAVTATAALHAAGARCARDIALSALTLYEALPWQSPGVPVLTIVATEVIQARGKKEV
jgi:hypothetical protein